MSTTLSSPEERWHTNITIFKMWLFKHALNGKSSEKWTTSPKTVKEVSFKEN